MFQRKAQLLVDDLWQRFAEDDAAPCMTFSDISQLTADSGAPVLHSASFYMDSCHTGALVQALGVLSHQ